MSQHLMNTYARQPISFTKGEGAWLFDAEGNRYLDALAGVAVNAPAPAACGGDGGVGSV